MMRSRLRWGALRCRAWRRGGLLTLAFVAALLLPSMAQASFQLGLQDVALQSATSAATNQAAYGVSTTINGNFRADRARVGLSSPRRLRPLAGMAVTQPVLAIAGWHWTGPSSSPPLITCR